jgi:hypothetical protein
VLGLPEQIGGAHFRVDRIVGDHQGLGRPGEKVDADAAGELALRFRDERVARPGDHVGGLDAGSAERHRADRLHAAEHIDFIRAGEMHRGDDRGVRLALVRGGAGDDALDAGDLGRDDAHVRGGHQRVLSARHIAADDVDRDVLVAEDDPRQRLHLDVAHRIALDLREIPDLLLRELDVVDGALGQALDAFVDLRPAQTEVLGVPVIELLRQFAHRLVAAFLDVGKDAFHGGADLRYIRGVVLGGNAFLEPHCHGIDLSGKF